MSRTIRKSYFDYNNQSFKKYCDNEIREWTNSKNKKVWISISLFKTANRKVIISYVLFKFFYY